MSSMLTTLWMIIGAVTFGTLLEEFSLIAKLVIPILTRAKATGRLIEPLLQRPSDSKLSQPINTSRWYYPHACFERSSASAV